jgi:Neurolysin/Thimet oligopeptidase, N-terminal domain
MATLPQGVKDSEPLRKAVEEVQPERVALALRLSQSRPIYQAFKGIREGGLWDGLSEAQQRVVEEQLRDFVLGGVALDVRRGLRLSEQDRQIVGARSDGIVLSLPLWERSLFVTPPPIRRRAHGVGSPTISMARFFLGCVKSGVQHEVALSSGWLCHSTAPRGQQGTGTMSLVRVSRASFSTAYALGAPLI